MNFMGIALDSECGPSIAKFYVKFIGDVFIISNFGISVLEKAFGYLKLNIIEGEFVIFLDSRITFEK